MRRSVFGNRKAARIGRTESFFIEVAVAVPVFALCCCAVLYMLAQAAERADHANMTARAAAYVQSWCELYSATGSSETAAAELFGEDAEKYRSGVDYYIPVDMDFVCCEGSPAAHVSVKERSRDASRDELVYGLISEITVTVIYDGGQISADAVYYEPYDAVINLETEE